MEYIIIQSNSIKSALELIWRVFLEYEAPEYTDAGVEEFRRFIDYDSIAKKHDAGKLPFFGCYDGEILVGVLAMRDVSHICMLFVDRDYHRRGIATRLFDIVKQKCIELGVHQMTVNSSPYAIEFYHSLGYTDTDDMQEINGIKYVPMVLNLE